MSFEDGVDKVTKRIRDFAALQLREEFPYMKTASLEKLLDSSVAHLQRDIVRQKPEMQKTLARTGFMSLSPELRNSIYELVLSGQDDKGIVLGEDSEVKPPYQLALLRVSRQVHDEASSILYGSNSFKYDIDLWSMDSMQRSLERTKHLVGWLQRIGSHAAMVKTIVLYLSFDCRPCYGLEDLLRSGQSLADTGLTVNQTVLQLCGLLGVGVADKAFKVKCTDWDIEPGEQVMDIYKNAGVDGSELFTDGVLRQLETANAARIEEWKRRQFG